jgi:hypothetical protein
MPIAYELIRTYCNGRTTIDGRKQITLRANSSYATSSVTNTTRTALQMNQSLRDENPASYSLNYDTTQNFQYVYVLISVTNTKNNPRASFPLHQSFKFCSMHHYNKSKNASTLVPGSKNYGAYHG